MKIKQFKISAESNNDNVIEEWMDNVKLKNKCEINVYDMNISNVDGKTLAIITYDLINDTIGKIDSNVWKDLNNLKNQDELDDKTQKRRTEESNEEIANINSKISEHNKREAYKEWIIMDLLKVRDESERLIYIIKYNSGNLDFIPSTFFIDDKSDAYKDIEYKDNSIILVEGRGRVDTVLRLKENNIQSIKVESIFVVLKEYENLQYNKVL